MEPVFPTDILVEIFSHIKSRYSFFRLLDRKCSKLIISWDGWDALIDQGFEVFINRTFIDWTKNGKAESLGDLPTIEWHCMVGVSYNI